MISKKFNLNEATVADKIDQVAEPINAEDNIITPQTPKGIVEQTLDRALVVSRRANKRNTNTYMNVLFIGEAGTGKTTRIRDWCKENNINLFEVRAAGMDDTDLGGAITPDKSGEVVKRLASTEFDVLDRPNSVLFLDEYNRAPSSVRTNLLELINSHVVPDSRQENGQRKLNGFLFTIAAINPASIGYGTDQLDLAELSRFYNVSVPPEKGSLLVWTNKQLDAELEDAKAEKDEEWVKEVLGKKGIANTLLKSKEFVFDTPEDMDKSRESGNGLPLMNRTFTFLLNSCDGTKQDFLDKWNNYCNSNKKTSVERILKDYKDVNDKANDALKGHDSESSVFKKEHSNYDKITDLLSNL